jgi:hypothetical protein
MHFSIVYNNAVCQFVLDITLEKIKMPMLVFTERTRCRLYHECSYKRTHRILKIVLHKMPKTLC